MSGRRVVPAIFEVVFEITQLHEFQNHVLREALGYNSQ